MSNKYRNNKKHRRRKRKPSLLQMIKAHKKALLLALAAVAAIGIALSVYFVIKSMPKAFDSYPQLIALRNHVFDDSLGIADAAAANLRENTIKSNFYAVFISICDIKERARVFTGTGNSIKTAWDEAERAAALYVKDNGYDLAWAKADIVDSMRREPVENLNEYVVSTVYANFYRRGISLDENFDIAFLEAEISGNKLITYYTESEVYSGDIDYGANLLHKDNINFYLSRFRGKEELDSLPNQIVTFTTVGFFADENDRVYELYNEGMHTGRRKEFVDDAYLEPLVLSASQYLYDLIQPDGKFIYGYFPVFDNWMTGYNIVRHASSLWSLVNLYRMTEDAHFIEGIEKGMDYLEDSIAYRDGQTAFLVEHKANEIKLGGNGVAIVAMSEYMDVFGSDKYLETVEHLANGILEMQDPDTGAYYHVWNYPDFTEKEAYRTVYYDGEATFALARAYAFTGRDEYLEAAAKAVEYFIENDYTRYRDHWVAYSMHEITKYIPDPRYFEFALKNVSNNLDRIYNQPTSYHTYLELLAISWQLYERILQSGVEVPYLEQFDVQYFAQALYRRAEYMLNSFFFPEYAMYMKVPENALGTFFVRHDSFRIRIDDIQHFIGGYYFFLRNYESISAYLSDEFIDHIHQGNTQRYEIPDSEGGEGEDE